MLTAAEARKQQEETVKRSSDISEVIDAIDKHTKDPDMEDSFIWWYKKLSKSKIRKLEKIGYRVEDQFNRNQTDYKISW